MTEKERQAWGLIAYFSQACQKLDDFVKRGFINLQHEINDYANQLPTYGMDSATICDFKTALLDKYAAHCFVVCSKCRFNTPV